MFRVALESFQDELIRRILKVAVSQHQEDVLWLVLKQQLWDSFDCEHLLEAWPPVVSHRGDYECDIEAILRPDRDHDVSYDLLHGYDEITKSRGVIYPKQKVSCLTEGGTLL